MNIEDVFKKRIAEAAGLDSLEDLPSGLVMNDDAQGEGEGSNE
jgi:hypothetical protein